MDIIETNLFGRETRLSYHYFIASIPVAEPLMPAFTWHLIVNELINNFKEKSSNVFSEPKRTLHVEWCGFPLKRCTNLQNLHETVIYYSFCSSFFSVFGLPCTTTCDNYMLKKKLQPGFNVDIIQQAASLYDGAPVIEASDEARALRYISFIYLFFLRCFE